MKKFTAVPGLGDRLRRIQEANNLTQKEMSGVIGIHYNTLQNYLHGTKNPDGYTIYKICQLYGVSADWLILGEGTVELGQSAPIYDAGKKVSLNRAFSRLGYSGRRILRALLVALLRIHKRDRRGELEKRWGGATFDERLQASRLGLIRKLEQSEWEVVAAFAQTMAVDYAVRAGISTVSALGSRDQKVTSGLLKRARSNFESELQRLESVWESAIRDTQ